VMHPRPFILWIRGTPLRRGLMAVAGLLAVLGVGLLDYATGSGLSFAAFYVLVIVGVTVAGGTAAGVVAAVASAAVWGVAEALNGSSEPGVATQIGNGIVRCAVHVIVVFLVAAVIRARDGARDSEARSRAFLASAAHQLRTPVAALGTSVEALLMENSRAVQERLLANAATEASRLGRLVASLLRTARLDQGEPLQLQPTDLGELCESELDRARQLSALEWRLQVEPGTPNVVMLDPEATSESLGNVLDNARRHAVAAVEVRISADRTYVAIEVVDDGPGLPSGAEAAAFDRFVTLDGQGGTGLGLSIARDLARRQGGELSYDRKRFVLALPRQDAAAQPPDRRFPALRGEPPVFRLTGGGGPGQQAGARGHQRRPSGQPGGAGRSM
jgi:signal transduction histidine kinase